MLRLTLISLALAWAVFQAAGVVPFHFRIATLAIAIVMLFSLRGPSLPKWLLWPLLLLHLVLALSFTAVWWHVLNGYDFMVG